MDGRTAMRCAFPFQRAFAYLFIYVYTFICGKTDILQAWDADRKDPGNVNQYKEKETDDDD
jgi:hypothetical protein